MTSVAHVTAMYATKRRRRNSVRTVRSKDSQQSKSNPSKRHRERLNQELDTLASLLPFEQSVLSKLDKLSILRLSVSYLRTKSYFQAALASSRLLGGQQVPRAQPHLYQNQFGTGSQQLEPPASAAAIQQQQQHYPAELRVEGDLIVQALNGFLLILTCDGEVFYTSHTVETYLGFHQSDICHQSVYELVHSEDRAELMQQLKWSSMISQQAHTTNGSSSSAGAGSATSGSINTLLEGERGQVGVGSGEPKSASQMSLQEILASAEHRHLLERNFTVRFRCLLDNTSGFLRLDIRGRIKVLHGQQNQHNLANSANKKQQQQFEANEREPMLAFFGVCIPFGPPSLLEMPSKDSVFKSKHRLDMSLISMDSRGRQLLGLSDLSSVVSKQTGAASASAGETTISVGPDSPAPAHSSKLTGGSHIKQELSGASKAAFKQNSVSAYDLVHHDDLSYMASAHQELLKTGASGLIAYRMVTQTDGKYQWLQTSAKLYYKNSKPDFILCTHRPLMDEEGRDLLGKRTMDFKVTYLDVGLSSINDRIMACDKFSSLQALGNTSLSGGHTRSKSPSATTAPAVAVAVTGTQQATTNGAHLISSPSLSGGSSRSLNSLSPQSMLNDDNQVSGQRSAAAAGKAASKRKSTYDLNSNHQNHHQHHHNHHLQQQQHQYIADDYETHGSQDRQHSFNPSTNTTYDQYHYKRSQNGDIFYDMDATVSLVGNHDESANRKSSSANKKKTTKNAKLSAKKQRDNLTQLDTNHLGEPLVLLDNGKATKKSQQLSSDTSSQVASAHQQVSMVDQQLHLYSHYNQQQHQHHLQTAADTDASSYPAIQAAAVYAASLGHQHPASAVAANQAAAYGSSQMQQLGYSHHNHTSQSLYGSSAAAAMVSPSSAYTQHQHHHSHLHHLDSTAGYQSSAAASHYGAFASHHQVATGGYSTGSSATAAAAVAASGSFLPAEHLLHHYSQSARSAALAASWPTTSATAPQSSSTSSATTDYHQHAHHSHQSAYGGSSAAAWNSSAAAAAAAALVASANTGTGNDLKQRDLGAYSPSGATQVHQDHYSHLSEQQQQYQHHMHAQHQQQQQQQQRHTSSPSGATDSSSPSNKSSSLSAVAASVAVQRYTNLTSAHGPASLNSDGSAHRSPISSSESSNGSGSLAAARAAAACSGIAATSDSVASNISPNTYYLAEQHSSQQLQQQQQHQQQQQQQQSYAHHNQQLAAYHQNPYAAAAAAHQYADSTSAAHFNSHHHYHSHHQQVSSSEQQVTGYFPSNTSADLTASTGGNPGHGSAASTMAATVKLYGANGESNHHLEHYPPSASTFDNKFGEWTRDYEGRLLSSDVASTPGQLQDLDHPYQTFAPVKRQETTFSSWAGETVESLSQSASSEAAFSTTAEEPTSGEVQEEDSAEAEIGGQFKDPLARLISYTIGDIMLDIAPQPTVTAATAATTTTTTTTTTTSTTITTTDEQAK